MNKGYDKMLDKNKGFKGAELMTDNLRLNAAKMKERLDMVRASKGR